MISNKIILLLALILALTFFALGRYTSTQAKTVTQTQTKVDETTHDTVKTHETVTEKKSKDGTDTIVTVIDTAAQANTKIDLDTQSKSIITKASPRTNISALAATSIHNPFGPPQYGLSVNREVLGPITIGAFGLTGGTFGISIGLNF